MVVDVGQRGWWRSGGPLADWLRSQRQSLFRWHPKSADVQLELLGRSHPLLIPRSWYSRDIESRNRNREGRESRDRAREYGPREREWDRRDTYDRPRSAEPRSPPSCVPFNYAKCEPSRRSSSSQTRFFPCPTQKHGCRSAQRLCARAREWRASALLENLLFQNYATIVLHRKAGRAAVGCPGRKSMKVKRGQSWCRSGKRSSPTSRSGSPFL